MKVGDLVKIRDKYKHDKGASRVVGVVLRHLRHPNRCEVLWANGVSSIPLCDVLDIISECKKVK